jgi:hypothetical protein
MMLEMGGEASGAPVRTRTGNQLIKSQLLYQLSYRGNQKNGSILTHDRPLSKRELECLPLPQ